MQKSNTSILKVRNYLQTRILTTVPILAAIKKVKTNCDSPCWGSYLKDLMYVEFLDSRSRKQTVMTIFPTSMQQYFQQPYNDILTTISQKHRNWVISYDTRTNFLAIAFPDVMMWDFDNKDFGDDPEEAKLKCWTHVKNLCKALVRADETLAFTLFETDRGIHVFLVSHLCDFSNMQFIEAMLIACNDSWYSAFVSRSGWAIRLNQKQKNQHQDETPDFIARPMAIDGVIRGARAMINPICKAKVDLQLKLIQTFRSKPSQYWEKLTCAVFNTLIGFERSSLDLIQSEIQEILDDTTKIIDAARRPVINEYAPLLAQHTDSLSNN